MIARKYKLSKSDFAKIKENTLKQKRLVFGNTTIFKSDFRKFGIVVSKKNIKKAHDRNKFKRVFYNFIKDNFSNLPFGVLLYLQSVKDVKSFKENLFIEINKIVLELSK